MGEGKGGDWEGVEKEEGKGSKGEGGGGAEIKGKGGREDGSEEGWEGRGGLRWNSSVK